MLRLKKFIVLVAVFSMAVMSSLRAELPVEIDVDLLAEGMNAETARSLVSETADEEGLSNREGQKALSVLENLIEEDVPVETAYEAVNSAVKSEDSSKELSSLGEDNAAYGLKKKAARDDVKDSAGGLSAEEVNAAVETLERLVEEGMPVEKARNVVKDAVVREQKDRQLGEQFQKGEEGRDIKEDKIPDREDLEELRQGERGENIREKIKDRIEEKKEGPSDNLPIDR